MSHIHAYARVQSTDYCSTHPPGLPGWPPLRSPPWASWRGKHMQWGHALSACRPEVWHLCHSSRERHTLSAWLSRVRHLCQHPRGCIWATKDAKGWCTSGPLSTQVVKSGALPEAYLTHPWAPSRRTCIYALTPAAPWACSGLACSCPCRSTPRWAHPPHLQIYLWQGSVVAGVCPCPAMSMAAIAGRVWCSVRGL